MAANVLVIDDDLVMRRLIARILERGGHDVRVASSVPMALELMAEHRPDVVCCDLIMPGIDGLRFLEQVRASSDLSGVPVIVITASGEMSMTSRASALGAFACLTKPFSRAQLLTLVESALQAAKG